MSIVEQLAENLPFGQAILNKLFELNSKDLKAKVKEICGNKLLTFSHDHLFADGVVRKILSDDQPWQISISYFDSLVIDAIGISFKPEHGIGQFLFWFDKNFKLD